MYRVLLTDDEIHICQLVQHLIDWNALQLQLVGVVSNGVDAFEQMVKLKPDIVISDIRMSGYSGIELLEKARGLELHCKFILISGYQQFEYAKKAIQLGVTDYIVKPIKKTELETALSKAIQELEQQEGNLSPTAKESANMQPYQKEKLVTDLQSGALAWSQATEECLKNVYGVDISGTCTVLCWSFVCYLEYFDDTLHLLEGKAAMYLEAQSTKWFRESFMVRQEGKLLQFCAVDSLDTMPGLELLRDGCQSVISIFTGWEVVLATATLPCNAALGLPLQHAMQAAATHIFTPALNICRYKAEQRDISDFHAVVSYDSCNHLLSTMQILDTAEMNRILQQIFCIFSENTQITAQAIFDFISWILGEMNHTLSAFEAIGNHAERYLDRPALEREFRHIPSLLKIQQRLIEIISTCIDTVRDAVRSAENRPIRQVKEIVSQHYMEQISLNQIAATVDLNPVYLSILFKKETGMNFKDYLTEIRIEMAKSLLREGENLVSVAEKVGYKDTKYFSKLFARIVGVNPTQYKKLYH